MGKSGSTATLSSKGDITEFSFGGRTVRFRTSPHLVRYIRVSKWDAGYIECDALYEGSDAPEEEYIDLVPILRNLYIEPIAFTSPIDCVEVCYA